MRSSLGFHTLTLIMHMAEKEARQLLIHLKKYSQKTGRIKIYPVNGKRSYKIDYYLEDIGITWLIRYNNWSKDFKNYIVEVTINPKILSGITDYITAATINDMPAAIANFDLEAKRISPILRHFGCYTLTRIDYCINFDLVELGVTCGPERIMELIRKANIPTHYEEWKEYNQTSHRMESNPASFYLISDSVNINCYSKHMQLMKRSQERVDAGLSPISQTTLDAARNIIRFEIQCKYQKAYALTQKAIRNGNHDPNKHITLLSYDVCADIINGYFRKIVTNGDWYTLQGAINKIRCRGYNSQKEARLIKALQTVNQCRSLAKAEALYQGSDLDAFKRTLTDLSALHINPVTIPKEWGVKQIPNLLNAYYDARHRENNKQQAEAWPNGDFEE